MTIEKYSDKERTVIKELTEEQRTRVRTWITERNKINKNLNLRTTFESVPFDILIALAYDKDRKDT